MKSFQVVNQIRRKQQMAAPSNRLLRSVLSIVKNPLTHIHTASYWCSLTHTYFCLWLALKQSLCSTIEHRLCFIVQVWVSVAADTTSFVWGTTAESKAEFLSWCDPRESLSKCCYSTQPDMINSDMFIDSESKDRYWKRSLTEAAQSPPLKTFNAELRVCQ